MTERAPWMLRLERLVREVAQAGTPLLGICFGHQIAAQALGGEVAKNPRGREIGTVRVERVRGRSSFDTLFAGMPRTFDVHATHVDAVARLPPEAEVPGYDLARSTWPHAFRVGRTEFKAVQFHPELDADIMRAYLGARAHLVLQEGGDPEALLARVHDGTRGGEVLRSFARSVVRVRAGCARGVTA